MVYQWKNIGVVTGRKLDLDIDGIPNTVYVAFNGKESDHKKRLVKNAKMLKRSTSKKGSKKS